MDIQKRAIKKLVTHVESLASAVSLIESGEQRYIKSDQQQQRPPLTLTGHAINKKGHFKGRSELHKTIFISTLLAYLITTVFKGDSKQRHS